MIGAWMGARLGTQETQMCAVCCKVAMDWFLLCSVLAARLVMNVFITSLAAILREASKLVRTYK